MGHVQRKRLVLVCLHHSLWSVAGPQQGPALCSRAKLFRQTFGGQPTYTVLPTRRQKWASLDAQG